jgi:hypothetical protein
LRFIGAFWVSGGGSNGGNYNLNDVVIGSNGNSYVCKTSIGSGFR